MYSRFPKLAVLIFMLSAPGWGQTGELRVCADPDNMPFSNRQQDGFENRIADLVAADLQLQLTYVWQRMGHGFVREYIEKSQCDLLVGIPADYRPLLTTTPYYRSTYVFVMRRGALPHVNSLNSPELHEIKHIGVQVLDEDYTPPAEALARRGLQNAIVGFHTTGENAESIVRAVVTGQVGLAIVWGPLAGYSARKLGTALEVLPIDPVVDPPGLPFTFEISMGVRKGNRVLRKQLEKVLAQKKTQIDQILDEYGVPRLPMTPQRELQTGDE